MTRTGKIARLSSEIREELNRRLQDNEPGGQLLAHSDSAGRAGAGLRWFLHI
jgi:hypothetical protein